jgi:hypothetical protein
MDRYRYGQPIDNKCISSNNVLFCKAPDFKITKTWASVARKGVNFNSLHRERKQPNQQGYEPSPRRSNNLKIGFWNAQSLKNKTAMVNEYMAEHDLDIYLIAESWLKDHDNKEIGELQNCNKYKYIATPRQNRQGGGLVCLSKSQLNLVKNELPKYKTFECMEVVLNHEGKKVTLVTIYRPEPSNKNQYRMEEFYEEFSCLLANYHLKSEVIVVGDFNFHVNKQHNTKAGKFMEILDMYDLIQHIKKPTHKDGNTLDLLITGKDTAITSHSIDEQNSDHNNILFELQMKKKAPEVKKVVSRNTKNINLTAFKLDVKNRFKELSCLNSNRRTNEDLLNLTNAYMSTRYLLDKHAPETERTVTVRKPTPWTTKDIKSAKIAKRKAEKRWRKTRSKIDYDIYRISKNSYNDKLNDLRAKDLAKRINDNKGNTRNMFKAINSALNRKQRLPLPPHINEKTLANEFISYFDEKINKIRQKLDTDNIANTTSDNDTFTGQPLVNFKSLTQTDVKRILKGMRNKHCKLDPMPFWLMKECLDEFIPIITEIINTSLKLGEMPDIFKHALIKPTLKKAGLELVMKNYRPVSNLQILSKVIESAVIEQYTDHLQTHNLLDNKQSAYKKFHSTETLLMKVHNDIMTSMGKGETVLLVLLDLSAAFDTIDHGILLSRLERTYGIKGNALKWFKSYMSDRTQSVIVNNTESNKKSLKFGVPQGSKLGPILFNSYIAPVSMIAKKYGITDEKYADDHQLLLSFKPKPTTNQNEIKYKMENCIREIRNFLHENKLCNNGEKTEFLIIGSASHLKDVTFDSIEIDNSSIKTVDKAKNLGVIFDKHMCMDKQVNKMCSNAYYNMKNVSQIRNCLNKTDTKTIVNALVTPHLDYGNGLLVGIKKHLIDKLQVAQNSAVRLIEKVGKYEHISVYRRNLHWLPIGARIDFKIIMLTWKALNNQGPRYLRELISLKSSHHNLRNGNKVLLEVPDSYGTSSFWDRSFKKTAPSLWNKLPQEVRTAKTLDQLKKGLKTFLFKKYYD